MPLLDLAYWNIPERLLHRLHTVQLSGEDYTVQPGDRIAQLMVVPVVQPTVTLADELDETDRGSGGLGSTGR